ncbi:hypothetical protein HNY73_018035 [Argiope bruennichi]|uniref:WAP domain-containing protein n=1 Tax=Argiope bruennichi TaxID=94029 RepID=A0A8T0ECQ4_ARGBR|nr:hypothetical protein HNY73_018035 [Argiope bruennichi]
MKTVAIVFLAVLVVSVVQAGVVHSENRLGAEKRNYWCPNPLPIKCIRRQDKCCLDSDCGLGKVCCNESCGNTCREAVSYPTRGREAAIC